MINNSNSDVYLNSDINNIKYCPLNFLTHLGDAPRERTVSACKILPRE